MFGFRIGEAVVAVFDQALVARSFLGSSWCCCGCLGADLGHDPPGQRDCAFIRAGLPAGGLEELDADGRAVGEAHDVDCSGDAGAEYAGAGYGEGQSSGPAEDAQLASSRYGALREYADALSLPQLVDCGREGGDVAT